MILKKIIKIVFWTVFFILICFFSIRGISLIERSIGVIADYAYSLPQPKIEEKSGEPSQIFDRNGNFLYEIHGDIRRRNVSLTEVPEYVREAFIAAEDHEFYTHSGISWRNVVASIQENLQNEDVERGFSTIPMQLARTLVLSNEQTLERKVKEIIIAILITTNYSKDQILERYLNEIPVGGNLVGVQTAAEVYFQKEASELSLAEGTTIAALINAPSRLSPYNSDQNLKERTELILDQMADLGFITKSEAEEAKREELSFAPDVAVINYPYFSMYVRDLLFNQYGREKIEYGGYKIYTSLNSEIQDLAEKTVLEKIEKYPEKWDATNAAMVVLDPKTGQILAMVGGKDYYDSQVNVTISKRQPGSSIKPFIYLSGFEQGFSDETMIMDRLRDFGGGYKPENYGGGSTGKWWTARQALIQSLNIPAVAMLEQIGVSQATQRLYDLGLTSLDTSAYYGLSMALGSVEVTPLEMARGASVLANGGLNITPIAILRIEKSDNNILVSNEWIKAEGQIADSNSVKIVNDILSDYNTKKSFYNTEWYKNYSLSDRKAAAKTGTSSGPKDCWLVGYTPNLVSVVWVGNNDGALMKKDADGINVAAPIWDAFMEEAVKSYPVEEFEKPEKVQLDSYHKTVNGY